MTDSIRHPRHFAAWITAAPRLLVGLQPRVALVVVPDEARSMFIAASPGEIRIEVDPDHSSTFADPLRQRLAGARNNQRYGRYLQQVLKLAALRAQPVGSRAVIWNSDTVRLRQLRLFDADGAPRFYAGTEEHAPYFEVIRELLDYGKPTPHSLVAQCLPVPTAWSREFFGHLKCGGRPWFQRLLGTMDPRSRVIVSEYETVGTYFLQQDADEIRCRAGAWVRRSRRAFGGPERALGLDAGIGGPDFAAFEGWERRSVRQTLGRLRRRLQRRES